MSHENYIKHLDRKRQKHPLMDHPRVCRECLNTLETRPYMYSYVVNRVFYMCDSCRKGYNKNVAAGRINSIPSHEVSEEFVMILKIIIE